MEVRELKRQEILPALHLIWEVFVEDVAPSYTPEGVAEFRKTIKYETILQMYDRKEITMFGAFDAGELVGTISVKSVGHIFQFYVKKSCQGRGAGRMLFEAVRAHCIYRLNLNYITVNAAPDAVPKYMHMGMRARSSEQMVNGIRFVPMEMYVDQNTGTFGQVVPAGKDKSKTLLIIMGITIAVLLLLILVFVSIFVLTKGYRLGNELRRQNPGYENYFDDPDEDYMENDEEEGLEAIPAQIGMFLPYEVKDDNYTFTDKEKQSTYIDFFVQYPVLEGLDEEYEEKVNQTLKDCAMKSVEEIYNHPSQEVKETVLGAAQPILTSYVRYKVCYASEEFISVAFEDYSCRGSEKAYAQQFRTVNIDLKTGEIYELKEIFDIDDAFADAWLNQIRDEEGQEELFSELSREEIKKTLSGDSLGGVYEVNFFLDKDGINVGYSLNYEEDDPNNCGYFWLTTAFEFHEAKEYAKEGRFWRRLF